MKKIAISHSKQYTFAVFRVNPSTRFKNKKIYLRTREYSRSYAVRNICYLIRFILPIRYNIMFNTNSNVVIRLIDRIHAKSEIDYTFVPGFLQQGYNRFSNFYFFLKTTTVNYLTDVHDR